MFQKRPPRIAILGSRGIPAEFGGFETFAEQLAVRLVQSGAEVTVFCEQSQSYRAPKYKGITLNYIATPWIVGLRSIWFDLVSVLKTLRGYDAVYMLGYHAAFTFFLPWLFGTNFWVNMDGLEWKRSKWSPATQRYLKTMETLAAHFSKHLVADAQSIADYLAVAYPTARNKTHVIEYGANPVNELPSADHLDAYGLKPQEYYLVICRLEPENHVMEIIDGFCNSCSTRKLIIVGDHFSGTSYVNSLLSYRNENVQFLGTIFNQEKLTALRYYCRAYFHGHSVGGTNPSLLEAMACGNFVLAHNNAFNREVTNNLCSYFMTAADFTEALNAIEHKEIPETIKEKLKKKVTDYYNWERIAGIYESLFWSPPGAIK